MFDRRDILKGGAATVAVVAVEGIGPTAQAQDKVVKIGMIAPL
jgi:TAT (twin-arginine translocation) pathway signal sequence